MSSVGPRPYRIVMLREDGNFTLWTHGFKTAATAQREADRLNDRPPEYRYGMVAIVRGPGVES